MDDLLTREIASLSLNSEVTLDDSCYNLLRRCLNNQTVLSKFRNFLVLNFCEENLCFYLDVQELSKTENNSNPSKLRTHTVALFEKYFKEGGPNELNIPCEMKDKVRDHINELAYKEMATNDVVEIFEETLCAVVEMLKFDCLPKFLKSEPEVTRILLTSSESQNSMSEFTPPTLPASGTSSKSNTISKNSSLLKKLHLRRKQSSSDFEDATFPTLSNTAQKAALLKKKEKLEHFFGTTLQNAKLCNQTNLPESSIENSPMSCSPPNGRLLLRRSNSNSNVNSKIRRSKTARKLEKFFGESISTNPSSDVKESKNKK